MEIYLLTNRPEVSDTLFTWKDLQAKLTGELLNNLGNFVNRVLTFIAKPEPAGYGSVIPDAPGAESHPLTHSLAENVGKICGAVKLKQGLKIAMSISNEGERILAASRPWEILPRNHKIGTPQPLFKELTDEEVQQ
ncbi:putative methionine--tRNA ligase [Raphanus sativus]|nr:putative methionine--tRNA ligase [Raphanus sativus]